MRFGTQLLFTKGTPTCMVGLLNICCRATVHFSCLSPPPVSFPAPLPPAVQLLSSQGGVGDVAPYADSRGSVRHRQHLQLTQAHIPLHCQLAPRAPADLTREDAAGHPQVPLHLLSGETF